MNIDKPESQEIKRKHAEKIEKMGDFKRERNRLAEEKQKAEILSQSRDVRKDLDIHPYFFGALICQIIFQPSFDTHFMWDIRALNKGNSEPRFELYENEFESIFTIKAGYKKLRIESIKLEEFLNKIAKINIPLKFERSKLSQLDGNAYGIHLFEYPYSIKIEWNDLKNNQAGFNELKKVVNSFIDFILEGKGGK